ncbi:MAG: large repetitive protein, partial [bacterium]
MGLRSSRWAKSTMVAGVLAVVLSYAAPPISAAAAAGSAGTGLPGLDSPSFAFPNFDEPSATKAASDAAPADGPTAPANGTKAGGAGDATQADGAAGHAGAPAATTGAGSSQGPAAGGSVAPSSGAAAEDVSNVYDTTRQPGAAPAGGKDPFAGVPIVEDNRGAPAMTSSESNQGHAQTADPADAGYVKPARKPAAADRSPAAAAPALSTPATAQPAAPAAPVASPTGKGSKRASSARPANQGAQHAAPAADRATPGVPSDHANANATGPAAKDVMTDAAASAVLDSVLAAHDPAPAPAPAAAPAPQAAAPTTEPAAPAEPASSAETAAASDSGDAGAASETSMPAAVAEPAEPVAGDASPAAADAATADPAPAAASAPPAAAQGAPAPGVSGVTGESEPAPVAADARPELELESATPENAAAPSASTSTSVGSAPATTTTVTPVAAAADPAAAAAAPPPPPPPAVSQKLLEVTGATLSDLGGSAPAMTSRSDGSTATSDPSSPAAIDAAAINGGIGATEAPQMQSATGAPSDPAPTGPAAMPVATAPTSGAASDDERSGDLDDEPSTSDPGDLDGPAPPEPMLLASADGDPGMARGPPADELSASASNPTDPSSHPLGVIGTDLNLDDTSSLLGSIPGPVSLDGDTAIDPPPGSTLVLAAEGGTVTAGTAQVVFAPGSLPSDAYVLIAPSATPPATGLALTSAAYDLFAWDALTGEAIENFLVAPQLTIGAVNGIDAAIYYLPAGGGAPERLASSFDRDNGAVTAGLPHFSTFAAAASEWTVTLADGADHDVLVAMSGADLTVAIDGGAADFGPATFSLLRIVGGNQADRVVISYAGGAISGPIVFEGNGGDDTLTAPDVDNAWSFSGIDGGTLKPAGGPDVEFSGVENVAGGNAKDTFQLGGLGIVTGSIDGGAGLEELLLFDAVRITGDIAFSHAPGSVSVG